jgi:hypothetical protein
MRTGFAQLTRTAPSVIFRAPHTEKVRENHPTGNAMVSSSQQFERIRKRKSTKNGKWNKRTRRRLGTPAFPVHPEGYDPKAADAAPTQAASSAETKR